MTGSECPDPLHCPVPDVKSIDLRGLRLVAIPKGTIVYTAYRRKHWPKLFNPSAEGNARFSPLVIKNHAVPVMYGAVTQTVALLETCFHDVHETVPRIISKRFNLEPFGLVTLLTPMELHLADITDEGLARIGIDRRQLSAAMPQHYICTREWAFAVHERVIDGMEVHGLLWQSRIAEIARVSSLLLNDLLLATDNAFALFGDRVSINPNAWHPGGPHYDDLTAGNGLILAEQIAEQLDAVIM